MLIASHLPSYELRHNQVESIFISAIDMYGHEYCPENLKVGNRDFPARGIWLLGGFGEEVWLQVAVPPKTAQKAAEALPQRRVAQGRGCAPSLPDPTSGSSPRLVGSDMDLHLTLTLSLWWAGGPKAPQWCSPTSRAPSGLYLPSPAVGQRCLASSLP